MDVAPSRSTQGREACGSGASDRGMNARRPSRRGDGGRHHPSGTTPPLLALALAAVGCGGGAPGSPTPGGLAYAVPDPNPATYTFSDTATFEVETAGMGAMEVTTAHEGTAELLFRPADGGFSVQVRVPRFSASFINPMQDPVRVSERDIAGPLGLSVGPRGVVTVTDTPSLSRELLDIVGPESLVRPLFVRLPGRAVEVGDRWIDTVTTNEAGSGTTSVGRSIITSTLVGDTVVAGERVLRIDTRAENVLTVEGTSGGVEIAQTLTGTTTGTVLWSTASRALVERWEEGELSGTLELPGVNAPPMSVHATVHRSVSLRP
jgi:hypothetical protein